MKYFRRIIKFSWEASTQSVSQEIGSGYSRRPTRGNTHSVLKALPSLDGREVAGGLAVKDAQDLALDEHREALVEPEVLPAATRDEVARPAVGDLMDDNVNGGPVTSLQID